MSSERWPIPSEENDFLCSHVTTLRDSFRHWTGRELAAPGMSGREAARFLFLAPFALVSHDNSKDPVFNYANQTALNLFAMSWEEFTSTPSRLSAEPVEQAEREQLLAEVGKRGFIENYTGVRIGRHGRRFLIENALVWNLIDASGRIHEGQAALFKNWTFL